MNTRRRVIYAVFLAAIVANAFYLGVAFGRIYEAQKIAYEPPAGVNTVATVQALLNRQRTYAQFHQDLWVALGVGQGKRNGYYVDVGSADGELISNTYLLDQLGWKGICIDPFPRNMQRRTCRTVKQPVYSESGKHVRFRAAGLLGGIESGLGKFKGQLSQAPMTELVTTTIDEVLDKAGAPKWIDYMNLDIEGAEYDALRGLSLDKHDIGSFTIEHNQETEKREAIRRLLESKGYARVRSWEVDDWYVHPSLAGPYKTVITFASR